MRTRVALQLIYFLFCCKKEIKKRAANSLIFLRKFLFYVGSSNYSLIKSRGVNSFDGDEILPRYRLV